MPIVLIILLMLVFVGGVGGGLFLLVKRLDPMQNDKTEDSKLEIAQDFLPFDDIRNNMIILPNHCYRSVIECSALNYDLKTEGERDQIEMSFQQFINSLNFPISIFLQTKEIDNSRRIETLRDEISKTLVEFPGMKNYADHFMADMENLSARIGNNQQKKRYIIVSYDDALALDGLTDGEKAAYANKELLNRCNAIRSGLDAVGIITKTLSTAELIELVYSCYNREGFSYSEAISNNEAFALFVDGVEDKFVDLPRVGMLDLILGEAINKLRAGNVDSDKNGSGAMDEMLALQKETTRRMEQIRLKYAGYFTEGGES
ncbi:hypothetical protein [uncultured Flavonifractor sp.]|uniref:hypothetical protein n=1 Tax=uncultured Flavonifractor sp. TaxID=1193534 RepID=UPI0025959E7F|nr:hypothetical protein [uncultured Flavonifractor sp.]